MNVPVHRYIQFPLHDGRGLLDKGTVVDIRCRIRLCLVIDEMQGDGGGFFPGGRDFQRAFFRMSSACLPSSDSLG